MRSKLLRITPSENSTKRINIPGGVIVVRSGAYLTHRIHFTPPSEQPHRDASSFPLENGRAYYHRDGAFRDFWLSYEGMPTPPEDLLLEVFECATPVVVLNEPRRGFEIRHVKNSGLSPEKVEIEETKQLFEETFGWAVGHSVGDTNRRLVHPRGFIGGGASADEPFTLQLFAAMQPDAADPRYVLATFECDTADQLGRYSCSFQDAGSLIPWPVYGLSVSVLGGPAAAAFVGLLLYELVTL